MSATQTGLQLCTFRVGDLYLGIDVLEVEEVLYQADLTAVPHAAPAVCGLINLRGQIATTIDLRNRLGLEPRDEEARPIHVVVRSAGESISLLVDSIGDVLEVDPAAYEPPPETTTGPARDLILGAYKLEDELLLTLDVRKAAHAGSPVERGVNQ